MKIPKNVSAAKLAANRKNGTKSGGPKSVLGRERAKRNAIAHGFFARELVLDNEARAKWEKLRRRLQTQLAPKTVLQDLKFAEIMVCIGRCLLGLRLDMHYINRLLGQGNSSAQPEQAGGATVRPEWYLSNKQGLREGMRLLGEIKQEFLCSARIDEKWHVVLDKAFGR